jgi:hypothetical protein
METTYQQPTGCQQNRPATNYHQQNTSCPDSTMTVTIINSNYTHYYIHNNTQQSSPIIINNAILTHTIIDYQKYSTFHQHHN